MERNGRIQFSKEGVTWCMYIDFSYGRDLSPGILADLEVEKPEEYGENFMQEHLFIVNGNCVILHTFNKW